MQLKSYLLVVAFSASLFGCSLFSINKPDQRVTLFTESFTKQEGKPITSSISFTNTTTNPFLNTNAIIIREQNTLSKLKGAVWTDSIASLVNYTILSALRSSSRFSSISTDVDGIIALYTLQTSLMQWNIEKHDGVYYIVGELYANIISKKKSEIFAQNRWILRKEIKDLSIGVVSQSFQDILDSIIPDFIQWAETVIERIDGVK